MIPRRLDIEPGSHPDVLDGKYEPQEELHRHRQQHADGKELKRHVLKDARVLEQLQLEWIGELCPRDEFLRRQQVTWL